jgi:MFS family permease
VAGYDARTTGLAMIVVPVTTALLSSFSGYLSDKYGPHRIAPMAVVLWGFGLVLMSGLSATPTLWDVAWRVLLVGIGISLFFTPINSSILGSLPKEQGGVANGIMSVVRTMGQISGISIGAFIWTYQVNLIGGQHYNDISLAPQNILHQGYSTTMLIGAAICWSGLLLVLFRTKRPPTLPAATA